MPDLTSFSWAHANLQKLLAFAERQPQAILLEGLPGIGKSDLAGALAAALLCETHQGRAPACGRCGACGWFNQGNHPDFRLLTPIQDEGKGKAEGAYEIKIGQIREVADFVSLGAHRAGRRIVVVDPADVLNTVSANALLKTLEEPTPGMLFVLVSSQPQRLPATVRSRCLKFRVDAPRREAVLDMLASASNLPRPALSELLALAGESPRLALLLLDSERRATYEAIVSLIAELPDADPMAVADRLTSLDVRIWFDILRRWLSDLARVRSGAAPRVFVSKAGRLAAVAGRVSLGRLTSAAAQLDRQSAIVSRPLNPRLLCETLLFDYLEAFTPEKSERRHASQS